jgi:hypothetical protein
MSTPIHLTDEQLDSVMNAARPLEVNRRDAFLHDVAEELARLPIIGNGELRRILTQVQRRHFDAPEPRAEARSRAY